MFLNNFAIIFYDYMTNCYIFANVLKKNELSIKKIGNYVSSKILQIRRTSTFGNA